LSASILGLVVAGLPITRISAHAEEHCPRNIASVTPRVVARALIVIPVKINQSGPFDFMVDTGSQLTIVDPALASQLGLNLVESSVWWLPPTIYRLLLQCWIR
jgi:hypothetical protein